MTDSAALKTPGSSVAAATTPSGAARHDRLKRFAAIASVSVAGLLIAAKTLAWLLTGSVGVLSTLVDSVLDLAASIVTLVAVRHAMQPADREHRFGHGKAEPIAGLAQAAFVFGSAGFLMFEAGQRLVEPAAVVRTEVGLAVMGLSIVLTLALVLFQRFVVKRTGSVAIGADALHYRADLLSNLAVITALVLVSEFGAVWADPVVALAIGAYLLSSAWKIIRQSLDFLMDRELPDDDRVRIRDIVTAHAGVIDMHDLRTRSSGTRTFIQFHLEMDGGMTLLDAHAIADQVMRTVEAAFPGADVLIHEDPYGVAERRATFE